MPAASVDNSAYAQLAKVLSQDIVNKIALYIEVKKVITQAEYVSAQEVIAHQLTY
ncbi:MAG: hypothetical protein M3Z87_16850 [Lactobacillus sp.]|nr:hypothetical protein [Lactobacillus sp.]